MFKNDSTENLLDNLESELAEVIELDNPNPQKVTTEVEIVGEKPMPIPLRRNLAEPSASQFQPVPAARRLQLLDKKDKNDENEIIQLSSMSSSASESNRNFSQKTVLVASERRATKLVPVVHESSKAPTEETFFVIKHGKLAQDEKAKPKSDTEDSVAIEIEPEEQPAVRLTHEPRKKTPEKRLKKKPKNRSTSSSTSEAQTTLESTTASSSSEEEVKVVKKAKKRLPNKDKRKKKKPSSDDQVSSTEDSIREDPAKVDLNHSIGIFIHSTGTLEFSLNLKSPRVKISFYNEDSGKQIGDSMWSKCGNFNGDFHNLICTWNEMLVMEQDFERLKEIYNNVLVFFEVLNAANVTIFWAFMKLFSPSSANIDNKFQIQLYEHRKTSRSFFRRDRSQSDANIFDQWRSINRKMFPGILNISVKILNRKKEDDEVIKEAETKVDSMPADVIGRKWQKLPGQACKIPNKMFQKIAFHEKGSMNVKFSHDGNLIAFTEVTKDGTILRVQRFPEMQELFTMLEHSELVHDIDWLRRKPALSEQQWMVTGSSDFTAVVWRLEQSCYTYHILPHPSFVYASKFLQSDDTSKIQIVTAGRDCFIRIWQSKKKLDGFELVQEMKHPNSSKSTYLTAIATRNADTFYSANSIGDVIEWTLRPNKEYHLNRHFKLDEISGKIVTSLELHPRGNKIFIRVQDFDNSDVTGTIYVLGVPTGLITQRHHQPAVSRESQGRLKVTACGSHLFASNGTNIRFYSLSNGNVTSSNRNFLNIRIPSGVKISSMDYHPKDFYFACSIYGRNGGVLICHYEPETEEKDLFEKLKMEPSDLMLKSQLIKATGANFNDIIRKLDEVFLAPIESDASKRQDNASKHDDNTFTVDSKRSRTYTVSQGPATYTVQKSQNNTYEIQRKDESDEDDTTISESFN